MSCTEAQKRAYREYYKRNHEKEQKRYHKYYEENKTTISKKRKQKYIDDFEYAENIRKQAREYKIEKQGVNDENKEVINTNT